MVKNLLKCVLVLLISLSMNGSIQAGIYEDVKNFVTTNADYGFFLTVGTGICSYILLKKACREHGIAKDDLTVKGLSLAGALALSKIAQKYPGQTTVAYICLLVARSLQK